MFIGLFVGLLLGLLLGLQAGVFFFLRRGGLLWLWCFVWCIHGVLRVAFLDAGSVVAVPVCL